LRQGARYCPHRARHARRQRHLGRVRRHPAPGEPRGREHVRGHARHPRPDPRPRADRHPGVQLTEQAELFASSTGPPGFFYQPEFLSAQEERELLDAIGGLKLEQARYKDYTAKRRAASFGFEYDFSYNTVHPAAPIPEFLQPLKARAAAWLGVDISAIRHALVAEYRPGTALGWHRDVPNFELVCGISLGGEARMRFGPFPPKKGDRKSVLSLDLAARSAYLLRGDARWRWQHSIPATKALRYSITFRTMAP
jgi:alkylated DNA repair dioxygenase AlkB